MNFIKELYFGNISPCEQSVAAGSPFDKLGKACDMLCEELKKELSEENVSKLKRYDNICSDLIAITGEESYASGFRDGAKMMIDVLVGENSNLLPVITD